MNINTQREALFGVAWWNVNNFYHFQPNRVKKETGSRWPQSREEYIEKCRRVDGALSDLIRHVGLPKIIALGEATNQAVTDLRDRLLPQYRVVSLDVKRDAPTAQVAVLYAPDSESIAFRERSPIVVPLTPKGTRPMAVVDAVVRGHTIRIVACHWQSQIGGDGAARLRDRMAQHLSAESYDFIAGDRGKRHLMIIGDFNEEPYDNCFISLHAHRDRDRSKSRPHRADVPVKRLHLYNTSWRLLGEKYPHSLLDNKTHSFNSCAGTYYWAEKRAWRHFDQIIVSGGLIGHARPCIDENEVVVVTGDAFLTNGVPMKFSRSDREFKGLSDHLPICANLNI